VISIYPVPVADNIHVNIGNHDAQVSLLSSTGQLIQSKSCASGIHTFHVGDLANGLYVIKVVSQNGLLSVHRFNKIGK
jgi:Secretion system C-terminal sorting domain